MKSDLNLFISMKSRLDIYKTIFLSLIIKITLVSPSNYKKMFNRIEFNNITVARDIKNIKMRYIQSITISLAHSEQKYSIEKKEQLIMAEDMWCKLI